MTRFHRNLNLTNVDFLNPSFVLPRTTYSIQPDGSEKRVHQFYVGKNELLTDEIIRIIEDDCGLIIRNVCVFHYFERLSKTALHADGRPDQRLYAINFSITDSPVDVRFYELKPGVEHRLGITPTGRTLAYYREDEVNFIERSDGKMPMLMNISAIHQAEVLDCGERWTVSIRIAAPTDANTWEDCVKACSSILV